MMTVGEIETLQAGYKLDVLVAEKVMGLDGSLLARYMEWLATVPRQTMEGPYIQPKSYSTDIAAAWEVVEKLAKPLKLVWTGKVWVCEIFGEPYSEEASTAPLAICRAALRLVIVGDLLEALRDRHRC